jgi:hypothetical protein
LLTFAFAMTTDAHDRRRRQGIILLILPEMTDHILANRKCLNRLLFQTNLLMVFRQGLHNFTRSNSL